MYADDVALVVLATSFKEIESALNTDLVKEQKYFRKWHLTLNLNKSVTTNFHLNNRKTSRVPIIETNREKINTEEAPKYLGVMLDSTLTFKQHFESMKIKIKTRNNIIAKLAGTSCVCHANALPR